MSSETSRTRLLVHELEMHLEIDGELAVGDTVAVIRGNGPREGETMGTAIVTGFDETGAPELDVRFEGGS